MSLKASLRLRKCGSLLTFSVAHQRLIRMGDRLALEQIVDNLVSNAVRYGAGRPIHVAASEAGAGAILLEVRDSGPGISAANQARIFERFERAVRPGAHGSGFGVGLWIVRHLTEAMGALSELPVARTKAQRSPLPYPATPQGRLMTTPSDEIGIQRAPSGITGLDTILGGGFMRGGIYIVRGDPGAGKTILTNQICFNHIASSKNACALYVTLLAENHARMTSHLRALSFFDESRIPDQMVYLSALARSEKAALRA